MKKSIISFMLIVFGTFMVVGLAGCSNITEDQFYALEDDYQALQVQNETLQENHETLEDNYIALEEENEQAQNELAWFEKYQTITQGMTLTSVTSIMGTSISPSESASAGSYSIYTYNYTNTEVFGTDAVDNIIKVIMKSVDGGARTVLACFYGSINNYIVDPAAGTIYFE